MNQAERQQEMERSIVARARSVLIDGRRYNQASEELEIRVQSGLISVLISLLNLAMARGDELNIEALKLLRQFSERMPPIFERAHEEVTASLRQAIVTGIPLFERYERLLIEVHVDWDTFSDEERAQFNNDTRQLIRTVMKQVRKEIAQEDR
jgi:hypothetical protein